MPRFIPERYCREPACRLAAAVRSRRVPLPHTLIHVGLHKAASTFLQQKVFPHVEADYVFLAGHRRRLLDAVEGRAGEFDPDWLREQVQRHLVERHAGNFAPKRSLILSHEELSGHLHGHRCVDPSIVTENLHAAYPEARILLILRNPMHYLRSLYTYRVTTKGMESRSLTRFLDEEGKAGLFDKLEYDRLIAVYDRIFGPDRVTVLPMELLTDHAEVFLDRVFRSAGVPSVDVAPGARVNKSSSHARVIAWWRLNNAMLRPVPRTLAKLPAPLNAPDMRLRYAYYAMQRQINPWLERRFGGPKVRIDTYAPYAELRERFARSNARTQRRLAKDGLPASLAELGYPVAVQSQPMAA